MSDYNREPVNPLMSSEEYSELGITKRELFASNAQQAILGNQELMNEIVSAKRNDSHSIDLVADVLKIVSGYAVACADSLLKELGKQKSAQ